MAKKQVDYNEMIKDPDYGKSEDAIEPVSEKFREQQKRFNKKYAGAEIINKPGSRHREYR